MEPTRQAVLSDQMIEDAAREVQLEIWSKRESLFPMGVPPPLTMLEPVVAAEVLGLHYEYSDGLGRFGNGRERFETAGTLDRHRKLILISTRFNYATRRFTGAHEIGHFLLHPGEMMHRDRPVFEIDSGLRPTTEREADYFGACLLAPARLVISEFEKRFGTRRPLPLTDTIAFHLRGESAHQLLNAPTGTLHFAIALATTCSFDRYRFSSLTSFFGMSASAMAIRLRQLKLVVD